MTLLAVRTLPPIVYSFYGKSSEKSRFKIIKNAFFNDFELNNPIPFFKQLKFVSHLILTLSNHFQKGICKNAESNRGSTAFPEDGE